MRNSCGLATRTERGRVTDAFSFDYRRWPHPNGHVQAYLGMCGTSATACQNFDASQASYFKILGEKNGIQNTLRPAYDGSVDGNRYSVPIPANLTDGSYIFRFEL